MNLLLSLLMVLTPSWNLSLKPVKIDKLFQQELELPKSEENSYLILTFDQAKRLSLFKAECINLSAGYNTLAELNNKLDKKVSTLETIVSEKNVQIKLLERQVVTLRSVAAQSNQHEWNIGLIVLSAIVTGYIAYDAVN